MIVWTMRLIAWTWLCAWFDPVSGSYVANHELTRTADIADPSLPLAALEDLMEQSTIITCTDLFTYAEARLPLLKEVSMRP